ncbi:MAG: 2-keto-4-methylthiobutyrate aminotransferase [Deltaproteobacteria bacterium CG07_land_8_20_14_0_80_60_11]|nr:MAG: 2-keto-4-methylthiobutyrate aminotransferase [Deltaproteobacteria bacterium CG07_land_8_20_14_0_80_60_11]
MAEFVWLNDNLIPLDQARVSVNDRGFLYGDGLFETLRADDGRVLFLPEHLERLAASARAFRLPFPAAAPWEERLARLLTANGLGRGPARAKILLSRGVAAGLGLPPAARPTLVIWAQPYTPPSPAEYAAGWPVVIFPEGRSTFVGRHKSLNYLFYLAARQYALDRGAREALILAPDGLVSEGAATSLVYLRQGRYYTPASASALPGVTLAVLGRGLAARGLVLDTCPTTVAQLQEADGLWLANSLMGLMPVAAVNGMPMPLSAATAFLREVLADR